MKKVFLLSLGCPRNLLDSEVLLGVLRKSGFKIVQKAEKADVGIVNTCAFIEDAKQESIDIILQFSELKRKGEIKKLIVFGCLAQRYPSELVEQIPEIDGVFGTSDFMRIPSLINRILANEKIQETNSTLDFLYDHSYKRELLTPSHCAYVKIQEGCSNRCSYCIIPDLKGMRRSRSIQSVLEEIKWLKKNYDVKEIILIGQDTTSFGMERSGHSELTDLLREIIPLMKKRWIRLLYTHPAHFTEELINLIAETDNICSYVDLPIQHINDRILHRMNRFTTRRSIETLIRKIRKKIKGVTIRSSAIVGFPGETEKEFKELTAFLKDIRFERLGAFIYSPEENTPAVAFKKQVPGEIKKARFDKIMRLQQKISSENNLKLLNKNLQVLIEEADTKDPCQFIGRPYMDAPEVDGIVYVKGRNLKQGDFVNVRVTDTTEYDLIGETV
ncbi:MAG: 30S ribosomal protein S12 methylthiotransferase RimO [Candidatus Omnitrophota bacterium]